ncbi:MAG: hypothetical protein OHK0048_24220 [Rhodoferax sp.]
MLAAVALLTYVALPLRAEVSTTKRRVGLLVVLLMTGLVSLLGLRYPDAFPALFVPGQGLTPLKIALEWCVIGIFVAAMAIMVYQRRAMAEGCLMALFMSAALSATSELFFTLLGTQDQGTANAIGHVYKVAAYLYLFHATLHEALARPLERIQSQQRHEQVALSASPDGVLWVDRNGTILMVNPALEQLSGYSRDELLGKDLGMLVPGHQRSDHAQWVKSYMGTPHSRSMGEGRSIQLLRKDGRLLPVDIALGYFVDAGEHHAVAYVRDMRERFEYESKLQYRATHDPLTELPNRWLLKLQVDLALARAARLGTPVAVLFIDLDDFKKINDSYGHAVGDALLTAASQRFRALLRETDTIVRLGGDEFSVLLTDMASQDEAARVADKLLAAAREGYDINGTLIHSNASIGIAFYPGDADSAENLMRCADMAMYVAKADGRGTFRCYHAEMDRKVHEDMRIYARMKIALEAGGFELHFQPQVDVLTNTLVGVEALLRWTDAELGSVSPARFIPVAETTGLILPLSDWVVQTACQHIARWARRGTPLTVAVNFSAQQFRQPGLSEKLAQTLASTGATSQWLDIELTESMAMNQPNHARAQFDALAALGCRIALDDFGTGYSSLSYLKTLPVHKLKIDKSFMDGVGTNPNDSAIVRAIIAMAHSLGLSVVAEGVETPAQLEFLRQQGCEHYQGWLFSKAVPAERIDRWLVASTTMDGQADAAGFAFRDNRAFNTTPC